MADWRQIQARIRKAKNSPEALTKLTELYQRTRDAMVAWELGAIQEKAELKDEAAKWYTIAAQRFRRADWRKKAEEALTRLGVELPPPGSPVEPIARAAPATAPPMGREDAEEELAESDDTEDSEQPLALGEIPESSTRVEDGNSIGSSPQPGGAAEGGPQGKRRRRRGRRGGRGRHKGGAGASRLPTQAFAGAAESQPPARPAATQRPVPTAVPPMAPPSESWRPASSASAASTRLETSGAPSGAGAAQSASAESQGLQVGSGRTAHGRAGNPALASRMAQLESMLRRLLGGPLHRLDEMEEAPAGPGVFLLSDSDQTTMYYVESCQTLRIGLANLGRGGRSGKNRPGARYIESDLKAKLAEYLGINEAKVAQYIKEHCVVRWIQLDDDASHLAHFAIGVLRTPLNLD
jgi:hypothetical protein